MLEDGHAGYLCYGQMQNYSSGGMCVGSDMTYERGTSIKIRFDKPLYKAAPKTSNGTVRWCKEIAHDDFEYSFGVGIKYD
jgi:hypothetical protein